MSFPYDPNTVAVRSQFPRVYPKSRPAVKVGCGLPMTVRSLSVDLVVAVEVRKLDAAGRGAVLSCMGALRPLRH